MKIVTDYLGSMIVCARCVAFVQHVYRIHLARTTWRTIPAQYLYRLNQEKALADVSKRKISIVKWSWCCNSGTCGLGITSRGPKAKSKASFKCVLVGFQSMSNRCVLLCQVHACWLNPQWNNI